MIYIMLGGPATGKGTRSDILSRELGVPHISTGNILREASQTNEEIKEIISKGMLISDEIISDLLYHRLLEKDCANGFILDGYPRTIHQAEMLEEMLAKLHKQITKVIELIVPRELAFKRILERKECANCKRTYGIDFPSQDGITCDDCGGKLLIRTDDTEETLAKRLDIYEKNAAPIIAYYQEKGMLKTIDSSSRPENILDTL